MTRIKLILVQAFIDRHGRVRRYFRRRGFKRVPLRGLPGSDEFMKAYRAALSGDPEPIEIGASRTIEGTVNALVATYLDCTDKSSSPFKTFAPETQRTRRNILENFRNQHGDKRIFHTEANGRREHLQRIVNEKAATPFGHRNFLNTLHGMFDWAVGEGRVPENPTLGVKRQKAKTTGYKTWTEADIERFEAKHAIGTKGRLAFALLLYTGQRRGDVVKMGPHNLHRGVLTVDQRKTEGTGESHIEIPVHPRLIAIIETTPTVGLKTLPSDEFR